MRNNRPSWLSHSNSIKKSPSSGAIVEHTEGTVPTPIIAMLVAWLVLIFTSYSHRGPQSNVAVITFVLAALLISNSLYLILGMDIPFSGPIQISSAPL
jgi:hypothetical protein